MLQLFYFCGEKQDYTDKLVRHYPIYGITEFSENDLDAVYVNQLRTHLDSHQFVNAPHKHSTYIAVLFTEGSGTHEIDFNTYEVRPGSIFLLTPGQVHCWRLSPTIEGYVFFHTENFYNSIYLTKRLQDFPFFYLQTNHPVIYLNPDELAPIVSLFQEIYKEYSADLPFKFQKLNTLIDLIYIQLSRNYQAYDKTSDKQVLYNRRIKRLEKLIEENFRTKKLPKDYADLMYVTTRHLNRICQESLNQTTGNLILKRIILEAQRMLLHENISVSTVADDLGYADYSYFIRLFKNQTGETPKQFRERMKNRRLKDGQIF